MLNTDIYTDYLKRSIKPFARIAGGKKEVNCRCYYCPDSDNMSHGHFYIKSTLDGIEPSYFYCQKCHTKGIVTAERLLEWGIYDANIAIELTLYNKQVLTNPKNHKFLSKMVYNINKYHITDDEISRYKLSYINNRLGINLSFEDCIKKKIVLNLYDLIRANNISLTRHPNIVDQLDANFVGFLSYDNAFINMRNIDIGEVYYTINKRYINYHLFDKFDNTTKFYIIPNNIDILQPIKIHIAEGPFDILSILYNINNGEINNDVYAAATGSGYLGVLKFIVLTLKFINIEVHLYPDSDISNSKMYRVKQNAKLYNIRFFVHRNMYPNEKDFGVPRDRINESIIEI